MWVQFSGEIPSISSIIHIHKNHVIHNELTQYYIHVNYISIKLDKEKNAA